MSYIEVINESKFYGDGATQIAANDQVSFQLPKMNLQSFGTQWRRKIHFIKYFRGMDTPDEGKSLLMVRILPVQ